MFLVNAAVFGFLCYIWSRKEWINVLISALLFAMTIANVVCWMQANGFIVKI